MDHTTRQSSQEIPYGYCQCGCGQKTWIATTNDHRYGWIKGRPVCYIGGHNNYHADMPKELPNPGGLCLCGCGQPAPIAQQTDTRAGWIKGQHVKYCPGHGTRKPLDVCFWAKVEPGNPDECWLWRGSLKHGNYGKLSFRGQYLSAHRVSWELHFGPIPNGLWVLHKCDTPPCCNPNHLFLGTVADNTADMIAKGRGHWQK